MRQVRGLCYDYPKLRKEEDCREIFEVNIYNSTVAHRPRFARRCAANVRTLIAGVSLAVPRTNCVMVMRALYLEEL